MDLTPFGYERLFQWLEASSLAHWLDSVPAIAEEKIAAHGDTPRWLDALSQLPTLIPDSLDLSAPCLQIGNAEQIDEITP